MYVKHTSILSVILKIFIFLYLFHYINCEDTSDETNNNIDKIESNSDIDNNESTEYQIKVSIIIPTYNSAEFISRSVSSALNQTLKEIEVIVIDDHSTDNTEEIIKKFENDKRLKYISLSENKGPGAARNIGLDLAKGEFIGFIDSDDLVTENYFESLYELSDDKDIVLGVFVNSTNDTDEYFHHGKFKEVGYGCVGDTLWRRSFLEKNNIRFDRDSSMGEDLDFRTDVMRHKPRKIKSPDVGAYYIYKRRAGSLMNYDPNYINDVTQQAILHIDDGDDNFLRNTVIGVLSCLGVVGVYILYRIKKSGYFSYFPLEEGEGLIKSN